MLQCGVIGATGYAGSVLLGLLASHPKVEVVYAGSHSYAGMRVSEILPSLTGLCDLTLEEEDIEKAATLCDVLFLALPHGIACHKVTKKILESCVVIDLGADFRLKDNAVYEAWYKSKHHAKDLSQQSVYGLCELHHKQIETASLIANPGCYTTCSILTLAPLVAEHLVDPASLIIDALSGVSGAGRSAKLDTLFCECHESCKAYGVADHRHTPEIEQELSLVAKSPLSVQFTPHLVPMSRGSSAPAMPTCLKELPKSR